VRHKRTVKIARMAMFLALGVLLNYAEAVLLPTAFIAPGVKLGLANAIGLLMLYYFEPVDFVALGFLRVLLTSLFTGFGFNFLIGLSGWFVATTVILILIRRVHLSIFGLSIMSAVGHSVGQIGMVSVLYQTIYMVNYLPILIITSVIAGFVVAWISRDVIIRVPIVGVHE
jgi:heptaprenyl diphosphate synthase